MINRRQFLVTASALLVPASPAQSLLMISAADAKRIGYSIPPATLAILSHLADDALKAGPWSVTFHRPTGVPTEAGPNDYFSEGPYWWPDSKNPNGPYIRRDGERNPGRFTANHNDLGAMCEAVLALGIGAYFLEKPECIPHASKILSVWFVDDATRMNPNLEYGQAIRGITGGRGTGIIDTVSLIHAAQGLVLLATCGLNPALVRSMRQWFADYLIWMTTSAKGLDERKSGNNHATWWTAQVAAYATFTENKSAQEMAWDHFRNYLVPSEIQPNGSCPREEARTNSLSYSAMNLDAFATICRLAQQNDADLWHFKTPKGISVETAFDYLIPYILHPDTWRKQQISAYNPSGCIFPGLASIGLPSRELLADYDRLPRAKTAWVQFLDLLVRSSRS